MLKNRYLNTIALSAAFAISCDAEGPSGDASALEATYDQIQAIEDLAGLEGEAIDELRKTLPVAKVEHDIEDIEFVSKTEGFAPPEFRRVFGTDDRTMITNMSSYPLSTIGRTHTDRGFCTATLVGPRHILTASHCIDWRSDGSIGWLEFELGRIGSSVRERAWATSVHWYKKITGSIIWDTDALYDFAVVVLDRPIGMTSGWMGTITYSQSWDDQPMFQHVGYPTEQPLFQGQCAIDNSATLNNNVNQLLRTNCDTRPGHSGGPMYAQVESGLIDIVGVCSNDSPFDLNKFAGGQSVTSLVDGARAFAP